MAHSNCKISNISGLLRCPFAVMFGLGLISFSALMAAFSSEIFLALEPCILCIYQRWPFAIVVALSVIGITLCKRNKDNAKTIGAVFIGLSGLAMLVNSGIALYHTGVEQKWWVSAVDGCIIPDFSAGASQNWIENIMATPSANCADIPWQDPIIGLSMANYNVALCFGLFMVCAVSVRYMRRRP